MSIFHDPTTGKAEPAYPAKGALTGKKDPVPSQDRAGDIRHVPNAQPRGGR